MRRVFVRFLEEIEDTKKTFRNYLTFSGNCVTALDAYLVSCPTGSTNLERTLSDTSVSFKNPFVPSILKSP